MAELNLLEAYPKAKRDLSKRVQAAQEDRRLACLFGREYFDGTRNQGYGGFRYDGRWKPIVKNFRDAYGLSSQSRVLDVGCAKGFMMYDLINEIPGIVVEGIDVSQYAIDNALSEVKPFMQLGNAKELPYANNTFDLVVSINTVHNLELEDLRKSLKEIQRVSKKNAFIVVDAYRSDEEKEALLKWNLTAKTILHASEWETLFKDVGYGGDYYWFSP